MRLAARRELLNARQPLGCRQSGPALRRCPDFALAPRPAGAQRRRALLDSP